MKRSNSKEVRRVQFAEFSEMYTLEDHPEVECDSATYKGCIWYNRKEYDGFDTDRTNNIYAFQRVRGRTEKLDENIHSIRGLENHISRYHTVHLIRRRRSLVESVLKAQYRQGQHSGNDSTTIAKISMRLSGVDRRSARDRGVRDFETVADMLKREEKEKQRKARDESKKIVHEDLPQKFTNSWNMFVSQVALIMTPGRQG